MGWHPSTNGDIVNDDSEKIMQLLIKAYEALANFENDDGHIPENLWRIRNEVMEEIKKDMGD